MIWRVTDGRAGHDTQSSGLQRAFAALRDCTCHDLPAEPVTGNLWHILARRFPAGASLPDPDFIIGAGHGTHMTLLAACRARGGKTVVLMQPSLPTSLFDYCLIPAHDTPRRRHNVLVTRGVLNCVSPSTKQAPAEGLILLGGPSRHYDWDVPELLRHIQELRTHAKNIHWLITDSPRTPPETRRFLSRETDIRGEFIPYEISAPGWLAQRLGRAATVWVTEDSISMICEALTAGAAVGVLPVPVKRHSRITRAVEDMAASGLITRFSAWQAGAPLHPADPPLNEAARCAQLLLEKTGLA